MGTSGHIRLKSMASATLADSSRIAIASMHAYVQSHVCSMQMGTSAVARDRPALFPKSEFKWLRTCTTMSLVTTPAKVRKRPRHACLHALPCVGSVPCMQHLSGAIVHARSSGLRRHGTVRTCSVVHTCHASTWHLSRSTLTGRTSGPLRPSRGAPSRGHKVRLRGRGG